MWFLLLVLVVIFVILVAVGFIVSEMNKNSGISAEKSEHGTYTIREGKAVETDAAFDAWTSGDLDQMLRELQTGTNKIDRHFLLQGIVKECYKRRREPEMRSKCREIAELHISEFSAIAPVLKRDMGGTLPRVSTFQHLATVLTEDKEYEKAVEVCELAQSFGLHDGTKSGYKGRIQRIRKKMNK